MSSLIALGLIPFSSTLAVSATVLGTIDTAGQVRFPANNASIGLFSPLEFYFQRPAACNSTGCDFLITDATGVLTYTLDNPLSSLMKFNLPLRALFGTGANMPSLFLVAPGSLGGSDSSCVVNNSMLPNTKVPDMDCSNVSLDSISDADPNKQFTKQLTPFANSFNPSGNPIPWKTYRTTNDDSPYYRTFLTRITNFSNQGLDRPSAEVAVSYELLWELVDPIKGNSLKKGNGSLNATYLSTGNSTSWSAQEILIEEKDVRDVKEPNNIFGILVFSLIGCFLAHTSKSNRKND